MGISGGDGADLGVGAGDVAALDSGNRGAVGKGLGIVGRLRAEVVFYRGGSVGIVVGIEGRGTGGKICESLGGGSNVIIELYGLCCHVGLTGGVIGIRRHQLCRKSPCQGLAAIGIGGNGNAASCQAHGVVRVVRGIQGLDGAGIAVGHGAAAFAAGAVILHPTVVQDRRGADVHTVAHSVRKGHHSTCLQRPKVIRLAGGYADGGDVREDLCQSVACVGVVDHVAVSGVVLGAVINARCVVREIVLELCGEVDHAAAGAYYIIIGIVVTVIGQGIHILHAGIQEGLGKGGAGIGQNVNADTDGHKAVVGVGGAVGSVQAGHEVAVVLAGENGTVGDIVQKGLIFRGRVAAAVIRHVRRAVAVLAGGGAGDAFIVGGSGPGGLAVGDENHDGRAVDLLTADGFCAVSVGTHHLIGLGKTRLGKGAAHHFFVVRIGNAGTRSLVADIQLLGIPYGAAAEGKGGVGNGKIHLVIVIQRDQNGGVVGTGADLGVAGEGHHAQTVVGALNDRVNQGVHAPGKIVHTGPVRGVRGDDHLGHTGRHVHNDDDIHGYQILCIDIGLVVLRQG